MIFLTQILNLTWKRNAKNKKIIFITGMKVSNAKLESTHYIFYVAAMNYQCKMVVPFDTFSEETLCKIFSPSQRKCEDR